MWIWCLFCKSAKIIRAQSERVGGNVNYLVNAWDVACRYFPAPPSFVEGKLKCFTFSSFRSLKKHFPDISQMLLRNGNFNILSPGTFRPAVFVCWTLPAPNHQLFFCKPFITQSSQVELISFESCTFRMQREICISSAQHLISAAWSLLDAIYRETCSH